MIDHIKDHLLDSQIKVLFAVQWEKLIVASHNKDGQADQGCTLISISKSMITGNRLNDGRAFVLDSPVITIVGTGDCRLDHAQIGDARETTKL